MIEDMKALSNDSDSNEEAVTSEMIEAGATAILERVGGADLGGWFSAEELATRVYLAMAALNGSRQYPSNMKALRSIAEGATTDDLIQRTMKAINVLREADRQQYQNTIPTTPGPSLLQRHADLFRSLLDRITELESREGVLVEALKPFVKHYEPWMDDWTDDSPCSVYPSHTFGDLHRARRALHLTEETGG